MTDISRRLVTEALGTVMLAVTMVGSGIMAETLTTDVALALLANTIATGAILVVLISTLGPISGAHFNPVVSLVFALRRELPRRDAALYALVQVVGGIIGTIVAHAMFGLPLLEASTNVRTGGAQWFSEGVAAFGLVAAILAGIRFERKAVPCWPASTSPLPTGSRRRHPFPVRPWLSPARSPKHFPAFAPSTCRASSSPRSPGALVALALMSWLLRVPAGSALPINPEDRS